MLFDEVLQQVGGAGVYQAWLLGYTTAIAMLGLDNAYINFAGGFMDHWCHIPELENFTHAQQKYIAIPHDPTSSRQLTNHLQSPVTLTKANVSEEDDLEIGEYDQCHRFPLDFSKFSVEELLAWNRTEMTDDIPREEWVSCDRGWVYDQSEWVSTINSQVLGVFPVLNLAPMQAFIVSYDTPLTYTL